MRSALPFALAALVLAGQLHAADGRSLWEFAPFSSLRRAPAEQGAPANGQPLAVDAAVLAQALGAVRYQAGNGTIALFSPSELVPLTRDLADALSQIGPHDDLELMSAASRETGFLAGTSGVTARLFVREGKLNLIVQDARLDFYPAYSYDNQRMPTLVFGTRAKASKVVLKAAGAESPRADWVVLPLPALPAAAVQPAPLPAAPSAPAARPAPVPAAQPAPAPNASVEDRLRGLKRFRDQNLITEEEYAKQKEELLKEYTRTGGAGH